MNLPITIQFETIEGYDYLIVCPNDSIQERLNFVCDNPAGDPWVNFVYEQKGTVTNIKTKESGPYSVPMQSVARHNYIRASVAIDITPYVTITYPFQSGKVNKKIEGASLGYTPPLPESYVEKTILVPLVQKKESETIALFASNNMTKEEENYNRGFMGSSFFEYWLKMPMLRFGCSVTLNDQRTAIAAKDVTFSVIRDFANRQLMSLVWLCVCRTKNLPGKVPSDINLSRWINSSSEPGALLIARAALLDWLLPQIFDALMVDENKVSQASNKNISFTVPYPVKMKNGAVATFEGASVSKVIFTFRGIQAEEERESSARFLGVLETEVGNNHFKMYLGFSSIMETDSIYPMMILPQNDKRSNFFNKVEEGFKHVAYDPGVSGSIPVNAFVLPENTQYFYSNMRIVSGALVLTATPKY